MPQPDTPPKRPDVPDINPSDDTDDDTPLFEREGYDLDDLDTTPPKEEKKDDDDTNDDTDGDTDDTNDDTNDDETGDLEGLDIDNDDDDTNDDTNDDDDDDVDAKLERARQKALDDADGNEDDETVKQVEKLQQQIDDLRAGRQSGDGDSDGGDKPWWEEGSSQEPKSWAEVFIRAKQEAVKEAEDNIYRKVQEKNDQQTQSQARARKQLDSLIEEGLVQKGEERDFIDYMIEVGSTDMFKAAKGYSRIRQLDTKRQETTSKRKQKLRSINKKQQSAPKAKRPTFEQIRLRSLDDIVDDGLRGIKRDLTSNT